MQFLKKCLEIPQNMHKYAQVQYSKITVIYSIGFGGTSLLSDNEGWWTHQYKLHNKNIT